MLTILPFFIKFCSDYKSNAHVFKRTSDHYNMYNRSRFTPQDMGTDNNETALGFSKHVKSGPESSLATVGEDAVHPSVHSQTKCVEAAALDIQLPLASSVGQVGGGEAGMQVATTLWSVP